VLTRLAAQERAIAAKKQAEVDAARETEEEAERMRTEEAVITVARIKAQKAKLEAEAMAESFAFWDVTLGRGRPSLSSQLNDDKPKPKPLQ